jgi:hypothetical protein
MSKLARVPEWDEYKAQAWREYFRALRGRARNSVGLKRQYVPGLEAAKVLTVWGRKQKSQRRAAGKVARASRKVNRICR